ncbi:SRPBCC family protein [Leifsonia poae]|uniref:Activator of HSP90 ATPase n=1 Tax=Leifsonia poae TaxID=110933 RepID=A0A9W6H8U9_9MICO|nr:SRPBCC domain-containing protein [Leifsonia poae]GLJ75413.1 activator of HSP90 ATPase [Leifsonia poae]
MTSIELTRTLAVDRERVWRAFTETDDFVSWFWPPRFESTGRIDATVGGAWSIASTVTGMGVSGVFAAVDEPERLVFTWRWDGDDEETLVTITLLPATDGGTLLTVLHERFTDDEQARSHAEGWSDCLDRLDYLQTTV